MHGDGNCQVGVAQYFVIVPCSRCLYCMQKRRQPQSTPQRGLSSLLLQFRALSDQLYRTPHEHGYIRAAAIAQLQLYPNLYREYIPEDYQEYCQRMQQFGTWGDHVTLQAVADTFGVRIAIMTSYQDSCVIEIQPQGQIQSQRVLYLSFWAEVCVYGTCL